MKSYREREQQSMRELRTLQTEAQYRHEIHPLVQEELDDPELFDRTPHSLSSVCDFQRITAAIRRKRPTASFQNRADSERAAFAFLDRVTAPPTIPPDFFNGDKVIRNAQAA